MSGGGEDKGKGEWLTDTPSSSYLRRRSPPLAGGPRETENGNSLIWHEARRLPLVTMIEFTAFT